ncbi:putative TATA-box-binding protein [Heterosigma akashiwo virus 01]|jgi:TATA-box binding protein (TBP) (component of TFIID and TFIIIB)|uniref:Putative TATA-box-binding protein n=1 Tax=Heterosigma akashiwo virus 01 TaxID=97195 RepID=A0A1C9C511_HAV01|nr:putative TATA-box-binding protein [Heterosigma akashiwo virus 01]AOM63374.1 putative TATA-box-binding protein [Heterosigma akashiwo virus 01]
MENKSKDKSNTKLSCSEISISTITLCAISNVNIDTDVLSTILKLRNIDNNQDGKLFKSKDRAKMKNKKVFFNSTSFKLKMRIDENMHNLNIKIFKSGSVQVTGCKSEEAIERIITYISVMISSFEHEHGNIIIGDNKSMIITDVKIVMINGSFNIGRNIDRDYVFKEIFKNYTTNITYEPELYHGINLKWNNETILMFHTGKILITGGNSMVSMRKTYMDIINILENILL